VSVVLGSKSAWPDVAYAMDGEQNIAASITGFLFHFKVSESFKFVPVSNFDALNFKSSIM
jgi:hypothetical protein